MGGMMQGVGVGQAEPALAYTLVDEHIFVATADDDAHLGARPGDQSVEHGRACIYYGIDLTEQGRSLIVELDSPIAESIFKGFDVAYALVMGGGGGFAYGKPSRRVHDDRIGHCAAGIAGDNLRPWQRLSRVHHRIPLFAEIVLLDGIDRNRRLASASEPSRPIFITFPAMSSQLPNPLIETFVERLRKELGASDFAQGIHAVNAQGLALLYQEAITILMRKVCDVERQLPMTRQDVVMMCRAMLSCATLGDAIHCCIDFCEIIHPRGGQWALHVNGQRAVFTQRALRRHHNSASCLIQTSGMLSTLWIFGWLIGQDLHPDKVFIGYPERDAAEPLLSLFDAPVQLTPPDYGFEFPARLLSRPVVRQGREIDQCVDLLSFRLFGFNPSTPPLPQQIRLCLDNALLRGHPLPCLEGVAEILGTSPTTLRRRLRNGGLTFKTIREDFLKETAVRCLREPERRIEQISEQLGFSNRLLKFAADKMPLV